MFLFWLVSDTSACFYQTQPNPANQLMAPPPNPPSASHHPATPPRRRNARHLTRTPWTKCTLTFWAASSDRYLTLVFRDSYYSLKHLNQLFKSIIHAEITILHRQNTLMTLHCDHKLQKGRKYHEMPIATEWWTDPNWSHYRLITFPSWWSLNIQQPTDVSSITDVKPSDVSDVSMLKCVNEMFICDWNVPLTIKHKHSACSIIQ